MNLPTCHQYIRRKSQFPNICDTGLATLLITGVWSNLRTRNWPRRASLAAKRLANGAKDENDGGRCGRGADFSKTKLGHVALRYLPIIQGGKWRCLSWTAPLSSLNYR